MSVKIRSSKSRPEFTQSHHAMLFAFTARALISEAGQDSGETILKTAVTRYGEQRGRRMALRARQYNHPLDTATYLAYGEWALPKGEMAFKLRQRSPHARIIVSRCPWHSIWKDAGMMAFGRYFCLEIDRALVRGFNPELTLEIGSNLTMGGDCCEFVFKEANLTPATLAGLLWKQRVTPGKARVMPWDYHTAHLFRSLADEIGTLENGDQILSSALGEFNRYFSRDHGAAIKALKETDFSKLPNEWPPKDLPEKETWT